MLSVFRRKRSREDGWLAISVRPDAVHFAHGVRRAAGTCAIRRVGSRKLDGSAKEGERMAKELELDRYRCLTVLEPEEYQLLLVEAPNVPAEDLKTAVRWRVKDLLDYHVDDATIDVLDIPPDPGGTSRAHSMYAIAARNQVIQACIGRFEASHIPLSVIDIAETAQRNVAALFETSDRGLAFLHLGPEHALLTINYRGELYLARRIELSAKQLLSSSEAQAAEARNRLVLEVQRSFDHFDRQFPFVHVAKLVLGPLPREAGVAAHLAANLDVPVDAAKLAEVLELAPESDGDAEALWRLFPLIGASLRSESRAL